MKKIFKIVVIFAALIIIVFMIVRLLPNEKRNLIRDINNLKNAVEKEDINKTFDYFDKDYLDHHALNFNDFRSLVEEFFKSADSINIMMSGLKVWIDSTKNNTIFAHCSLGLRVIARYENEKVLVFGGVIQPSPVKGFFRKQKNYYRIYAAEY
uniref:Uncharacterized protein n=1 Tax=candidate division WOR-3 bacterium TaxID=2052148 RepID=A0A7V0Z441_UNCW3